MRRQGADEPGDRANRHGDAPAALELFRGARDLFVSEKNWPGLPSPISTRRWCTTRKDGWGSAVAVRERASLFCALAVGGEGGAVPVAAGRIHLERRREDARLVCLAALDRLEEAQSPSLSYQAYFVLGLIEEALGANEAAHQAYRQAHERLENLRSHLKAEETKIAFLKDKLAVYEALVRMCLRNGRRRESRAGVWLHRAGEIAQPGGPDRVSRRAPRPSARKTSGAV